MLAPQMATERRVSGTPATHELRTVFCKHRRSNGHYCNREAQPEHAYCWQHVPGVPKKVVSVFKSIKRTLLG
jgi:hypothetical protein